MRHTPTPFIASLALALTAGLALADEPQGPKGPPFADGPDTPKVPPKPKRRAWVVVRAPLTFAFEFVPGIPAKDAVAEVTFAASEKPSTPDPRWGSAIPLAGANLVAELESPAGEVIERYVAHPVPLAQGKYAFHFTPTEEGVHGLRIVGTLADGRSVNAELKVPVDVWPLPKALEGTGDAAASSRRRAVRRPISK